MARSARSVAGGGFLGRFLGCCGGGTSAMRACSAGLQWACQELSRAKRIKLPSLSIVVLAQLRRQRNDGDVGTLGLAHTRPKTASVLTHTRIEVLLHTRTRDVSSTRRPLPTCRISKTHPKASGFPLPRRRAFDCATAAPRRGSPTQPQKPLTLDKRTSSARDRCTSARRRQKHPQPRSQSSPPA